MEQQAKVEQAPPAAVEKYKQQMLAQARRSAIPPLPPASAPIHTENKAENLLERVEPILQEAAPIAEIALRSGLVNAGAAVAAKGLELGVEALEAHIERKRAERQPPPSPPQAQPITQITQVTIEQPQTQVINNTASAAVQTAPIVPPAPLPVQPLPPPMPPPPTPMPPAPTPIPPPKPPAPPPVQKPPPAPVPPMPPPAPPPVSPTPPPPAPPCFSHPLAPRPIECAVTTRTVTCCNPRCPVHGLPAYRQPGAPRRRPRSLYTTPAKAAEIPVADPSACAAAEPAALEAWNPLPFIDPPAGNPADRAAPAYQNPDAVFVSSSDVYPHDEVLPTVAFDEEPAPGTLDSDYLPPSPYTQLSEPSFASLEDFLARNPAWGTLTVSAVTGAGAPVSGAGVRVSKRIGGTDYLFYDVRTDPSGRSPRIALPAPAKQLSFAPPNGYAPYAAYRVAVTAPGSAPVVMEDVVIFADTESLQTARLGSPVPAVYDEDAYTI